MVISGYTLEEMSNKHALEFIAEEDRPAAQRAIEEVLDKGEASVEAQMLTKDGRKIPFFFTARKFILDGMPCILGTGLDITERKRTEEALRESEEHYRSLFQNNHSVMLLIDPETGGIMDANPAACSYYGFSRDKLLEKKISDVNTLSAEQVFQEMQRAKTEKRKRFEFRHRLASGEVRDVEVFSGPIRVKGMELLYSIVHDITARKQAEKALQESEKKYRSLYQEFQGILNAIPDVISLISPDLKIVWSNEATVVATQTRSAADLIGKYCYAIRHASSEPCDNCPVLRCFRSGKVETDESVANGWIWELRAVPIFDDHGGLVGAIELARNITERKQMEEALRESQALYQDLVETAQDLIWQCDSEGRY
ncbi:MAG: PAS domain-containing protein, partial [Candidatus Micrarchaeota archaeon]